MHYYKRNIGDYAKKAARLTMLQHGAYNLLIDACYDREKFPTVEEAFEWTFPSNSEEEDAVIFVLKRMFSLENGVYHQNRIAEEITEYRKQGEINSANGKKGGRPKGSKNKPKESALVNKETHPLNIKSESLNIKSETKAKKSLTTNHKPLTTNQEPITNNQSVEICNKEKIPEGKIMGEKELMNNFMDDALTLFAAWQDMAGNRSAKVCSESEGFAAMRLMETGVTYENIISRIGSITDSCKAFGDDPPGLESICINYQQPPDC